MLTHVTLHHVHFPGSNTSAKIQEIYLGPGATQLWLSHGSFIKGPTSPVAHHILYIGVEGLVKL